jgi:hypothetical protein
MENKKESFKILFSFNQLIGKNRIIGKVGEITIGYDGTLEELEQDTSDLEGFIRKQILEQNPTYRILTIAIQKIEPI